MSKSSSRLRVTLASGPGNVARVVLYRAALKLGVHPAQRLRAAPVRGPFLAAPSAPPVNAVMASDWQETARLLGFLDIEVGKRPHDWLRNAITKGRVTAETRPWWERTDM